jgi:hypothetical protein
MAGRHQKQGPKMALDDPRRKNLRPPVRPGDPPRNPLGKNGSEWLKAFRDFFEEIPGEKLPKGAPRVEPGDNRHLIAIRALFRNMIIGSDASLKLGIEQLQGRARQHIEVSGDLGNGPPVTFLIPENGRDVVPEDSAPADGKQPEDAPADK